MAHRKHEAVRLNSSCFKVRPMAKNHCFLPPAFEGKMEYSVSTSVMGNAICNVITTIDVTSYPV